MAARNWKTAFAIMGCVLISACTSTGNQGGAGDGSAQLAAASGGEDTYTAGFCPTVSFREGTTAYRTYERGGEGDPGRITYQASLADATRQCQLLNGQLVVNVVAAGRLAAGPKGGAGSLDVPIRVAVVQGDQVLYSELKRQSVSVGRGGATAQFVFSDPNVVLPRDIDKSSQIYVGFDEGPYNTP